MPAYTPIREVVQAVQWTGENFHELAALSDRLFGPHGVGATVALSSVDGRSWQGFIFIGDWVVLRANGGIDVLKPEEFAATYELVIP